MKEPRLRQNTSVRTNIDHRKSRTVGASPMRLRVFCFALGFAAMLVAAQCASGAGDAPASRSAAISRAAPARADADVPSAGPVTPDAPPAASPAAPIQANQIITDNYAIKLTPSPQREDIIAVADFDVMTNASAGVDSFCFFLHDELNVDNIIAAKLGKVTYTQSRVPHTLSYSLAANRVCVKLSEKFAENDTLRLEVVYHGKFTGKAVRSASDFIEFGGDGLFLRGPGYCLWFPTIATAVQDINVPVSMETQVFLQPPWKAVCQGVLSSGESNGLPFFKWVTEGKIPIGSAVLFASNYDTLSAHVGGNALSSWYFASRADSMASSQLFAAAKEVLGFFAQNYGEPERSSFPPHFTLVEGPMYSDFFSGAIMSISKGRVLETNTMPKRAELVSLIASKMVGRFTVPEVDSSAPGAAFLLESVPSYAYVPAIESLFGKEFVIQSSELVIKQYAAARKSSEAKERGFPPEKPLGEVTASEIPLYKGRFLLEDRGAYVLHMLRRLIGDRAFFLAIKSYMAAFEKRPSEAEAGVIGGVRPANLGVVGPHAAAEVGSGDTITVGGGVHGAWPSISRGGVAGMPLNPDVSRRARLEDFIQIVEGASGRRLDWFFSEWLYGDVLPDYRIADMSVSVSHDTTFVDVKVENAGTGLMPVPVALYTDKGQRTSEVWVAAHETAHLRFVSRSKPERVEIDPQKWILQADITNDGMDVTLPRAIKR